MWPMSEDEKRRMLGDPLVKIKEAKATVACYDYKLGEFHKALKGAASAAERAIEKGHRPNLRGHMLSTDERTTVDKWPTFDELRELLIARDKAKEDLAKLKEQEASMPVAPQPRP